MCLCWSKKKNQKRTEYIWKWKTRDNTEEFQIIYVDIFPPQGEQVFIFSGWATFSNLLPNSTVWKGGKVENDVTVRKPVAKHQLSQGSSGMCHVKGMHFWYDEIRTALNFMVSFSWKPTDNFLMGRLELLDKRKWKGSL